jgi:hypothetical protein
LKDYARLCHRFGREGQCRVWRGRIRKETVKFGPWFEFTVTPVMDIMDGVAILTEGVEFRRSID